MRHAERALSGAGRAAALALTALRIVLAPVIVWITRDGVAGAPYVGCCVLAFLSDIFDGVVARHSGADSAAVRRLDSAADSVFYLAAAWTVWRVYPDVVRAYAGGGLTVLGLEAVRHLVDFVRFRREAAYHAWSAKVWGISLFVALVAVMGFASPSPWLPLAIGLGIVAELEGLAMSLILTRWTHDVRGVAHAWRLRAEQLRADGDGA